MTFNWTPSWTGKSADLWIEGTFTYGAIVIFCNITILYGSYSHTLGSIFVIFASIGSFFGIFYLFSSIGLSALDGLFKEILTYPTLGLSLFFFFTFTFPVDRFLFFLTEQKLY